MGLLDGAIFPEHEELNEIMFQPGALLRLSAEIDARRICDLWPRDTRKRSKAFAEQPRKNWRGVPPIYRFLASIDFGGPDECWPWMRARSVEGYGTIFVNGRLIKATHISLELEGMSRPSPEYGALHSCDNPPCCNPAHLRWGSHSANMKDMVQRGRLSSAGLIASHERASKRTHCRRGLHILPPSSRQDGKRVCRICEKERRRVRAS